MDKYHDKVQLCNYTCCLGLIDALEAVTNKLNLFSLGPELYTNGTLIFRTWKDVYGIAIFEAVLTDDGGGGADASGSNSSAVFEIFVLTVNDAPAFAALAAAQKETGQLQEARQNVATALRLDPSLAQARALAQLLGVR